MLKCSGLYLSRSAEVAIGNGQSTFPCLTNCTAEFSLKVLQVPCNICTGFCSVAKDSGFLEMPLCQMHGSWHF
jgi:hypothetical protein